MQNDLSLQLEGKLCKVRHGISTTFESLPCQSHVAWQTLLPSVACQTKLKTLIQMLRFCRAFAHRHTGSRAPQDLS